MLVELPQTSTQHKDARPVKTSALLLSLCFGLFATAAWAALKPGDAAPDFTVDAALGGKEFTFSLTEALKKGPVVLYFYPKSFTSVCTAEAHEIENFAAAGASVIGLSGDKIEVQRLFEQGVPRQIPSRRRPQLFGHQGL